MDIGSEIGYHAFQNTEISSIHLIARTGTASVTINEAFVGTTNVNNIKFGRDGNKSGTAEEKTFIVNKSAFDSAGNVDTYITLGNGTYVQFKSGAIGGTEGKDLYITGDKTQMQYNKGSGGGAASFTNFEAVYIKEFGQKDYVELEGIWKIHS